MVDLDCQRIEIIIVLNLLNFVIDYSIVLFSHGIGLGLNKVKQIYDKN